MISVNSGFSFCSQAARISSVLETSSAARPQLPFASTALTLTFFLVPSKSLRELIALILSNCSFCSFAKELKSMGVLLKHEKQASLSYKQLRKALKTFNQNNDTISWHIIYGIVSK